MKNCQAFLISALPEVKKRSKGEERRRYLDCATSGEFYEFIQQRLQWIERSRDKIKKDVLTFLNCPIQQENRHIRQVFQQEFPGLLQGIHAHKENDYRDVSRKLQELEARAMIDKVAGGFAEDFSGKSVPLISIHDALVTTERHVSDVEDRIKKAFGEVVRCAPETERVTECSA